MKEAEEAEMVDRTGKAVRGEAEVVKGAEMVIWRGEEVCFHLAKEEVEEVEEVVEVMEVVDRRGGEVCFHLAREEMTEEAEEAEEAEGVDKATEAEEVEEAEEAEETLESVTVEAEKATIRGDATQVGVS